MNDLEPVMGFLEERYSSFMSPSDYFRTGFLKSRAFWIYNESLLKIEDITSKSKLDSVIDLRIVSRLSTVGCTYVLPSDRIRISGGCPYSIELHQPETKEKRDFPNRRTIGSLLAERQEALELLLLLSSSSCSFKKILIEIEASPEDLFSIMLELEQLDLITIDEDHVSLSSRGLEVVTRLRESTKRIEEDVQL